MRELLKSFGIGLLGALAIYLVVLIVDWIGIAVHITHKDVTVAFVVLVSVGCVLFLGVMIRLFLDRNYLK